MIVVKSEEEAKRYGQIVSVEGSLVWVRTEKGLIKVYKTPNKEEVAKILLANGFPKRLVRIWQEGNYQETPSLKKVLQTQKENWLFLTGSSGSGKTLASVVKTATLLENYQVFSPFYFSFVYSPNPNDEDLSRSDLIVLDDFTPSERNLAILKKVVFYSYDQEKTLYLVSNLSPNDLTNVLDQPTTSRLVSSAFVITFKEKDLRNSSSS